MTIAEIEEGFRKTVDQYYAQLKYMKEGHREKTEVWFIGGMLQSALHIIPNDNYFNLKQYIYRRYGYDSGGCEDGQISIGEWRDYDS